MKNLYNVLLIIAIFCFSQFAQAQERGPKRWARSWTGDAFDNRPCMVGYNATPRDYRDRDRENQHKLRTVEAYHFDKFAGGTRPLGGGFHDLDYTLAWFPNHHKALFTVIRLATEPAFAEKGAGHNPYETRPECRLGAAEYLFPKDPQLQFLYGLYLQRVGKQEAALERYTKGLEMQPDSAEGHYNLGLLLLKMERPEDAVEHARKAYKLGYPLPGLKRKLQKAGHSL